MTEQSITLSLGEAVEAGRAHARQGDHKTAIGLFRGVLIHEPQNFEAMQHLGASLFELKHYHEALYWFWRGRKIGRCHPMALTNYGLCVAQLGHWEEGFAELERARHIAERDGGLSAEAMALVYNNLGNTLEKLKRYPEALENLDKALSINPLDYFSHYNRGIVLLRLNRHAEAMAALNRAIEIKPGDADAHYNRGINHLLHGNFADGFAEYEFCLVTTENEKPNFGLPEKFKWQGEPIKGRRLLVHAEQGLGDCIQFFRFLPALVTQGAEIKLHIQADLREWASAIPGITTIAPSRRFEAGGTCEDGYDYWVALMSLPLMFNVKSEADIPPPYLPPLDRAAHLEIPSGTNVGVVWAGNWIHKNDEARSIPLNVFGALFDAPCNFISLQQIQARDTDSFAALKERHDNLSALFLDDFRETAAVIRGLDLVISADTAVAHLAASLGKPTWVLIPKRGTDWRWQLTRTDSPWYPSATLYRQHEIGDWRSAIACVRADLCGFAQQLAA
jgi:tetratricopeptide (TPR) repeat protein